MRILHVIASTDPRSGGPIAGLLGQERATGGMNHRAVREIVSLDLPDAPHLANFPIKVNALGVVQSGRWLISRFLSHYAYSPKYIPWIKANQGRFDVAIVHGLWNYSSFAASRVLCGGSLPYFVFTHGMMDPWFRRRYPLKHWAKQAFWLAAEGKLLASARSVLFTCEEERLQARDVFFGHRYRETVVGYGTTPPPETHPTDLKELEQRLPELRGRPFLLFLSRIHEKKGIDLLIEGFARVASGQPDLQLVIAGPDEAGLTAALKSAAASLGIADRIHWPGGLFGGAKWAALRCADAFFLPSHQENFGIVVAEALACGTPVLISDKVNIWREIKEDGAGLIAPDTVAGVEELLFQWLQMGLEARAAMSAAARRTFSARFDIGNVAPELLGFMADEIGLQRPWPSR
jgi:glycosyltransferase involved in cell wall biosynthesis